MMLTLAPSLNRFRLGVYCPNFAETYSFLRVAGPFETMAAQDRRLEIIRPPLTPAGEWSLTWDWILQCDALFLHHPFFDQQLHCIATARRLGRPVWVEFVDDMMAVPEHNPTYRVIREAYCQQQNLTEADLPGVKTEEVRNFVRRQTTAAIDLASVVTVTSQILKDALIAGCDLDSTQRPSLVKQAHAKVSDKILVVPEAAFFDPDPRPRRKCVTWRGLGTHGPDVAEVLDQWGAVARDFPDWEWALFGQPSREMVNALNQAAPKRVKVSPLWPTVFDLWEAWVGCAPYLHLVPLQDNAFARSKSHLAWLEASSIGAAVIVPDHLPEWQQPGTIPYYGGKLVNGKANFEAVLRRELLKYPGDGQFHPNVQTARQAIYPERTLQAMNQLRWEIVNSLASKVSRLKSTPHETNTRPETPDPRLETFFSHSQAGQDRWVFDLLNIEHGRFLDIGGLCEGRPDAVTLSNTAALEKCGWSGIVLDLAPCPDFHRKRSVYSLFYQDDATTMDFTPWACMVFDYLSLDVDEATLPALRNLIQDGVRWHAATIEHDAYKDGGVARDEIRALLQAEGYTLARGDVTGLCTDGVMKPFEDWWIDPKTVSSPKSSQVQSPESESEVAT